MLISDSKFYRHKETGQVYRMLNLGLKLKCPETGKWYKAVLYEPKDEDFGTGEQYVRTQKDFVEKFEPAQKNVTI